MRIRNTVPWVFALLLSMGAAGCADLAAVDPAELSAGAAGPRGTSLFPANSTAARAGIVVNSVAPAESASAWGAIGESGVGWVRLTAYWNLVEDSARVLHLDALKRNIAAARELGIQVELTVHGTPWWAQGCATSADPACADTRRPPADTHWNTWQWFMERLTEELDTYPHDVKAYGIWNEPNDEAFLRPRPGQVAFDVYLDFLRYAAPYVRGNNAWVVAGELAQGGSHGGDWVQLLAPQHQYWDVLALHQYNASTCTEHDVHRARSKLNGMDKQIWLTEAGTPTLVHDEMDQAKNVTGYLAEMVDATQTGGCAWDSADAQGYPDADWDVTFIWYMWPEDPEHPHTGLITDRATFNRRPAFYCLKAFARGQLRPAYCERDGDL